MNINLCKCSEVETRNIKHKIGFWYRHYTSFYKSSLCYHFKRFSITSTAAATILLVLPRLCFCPVVLYSVRNNTPCTDPPPLVIYNAEEIKRYDNLVNSKMEKRGKYWYCLECGKEFMPRNKQCAYRHIDLNHMSSYSFVCNFCTKSFIAKSNLNYHIKNCKEVPKN